MLDVQGSAVDAATGLVTLFAGFCWSASLLTGDYSWWVDKFLIKKVTFLE